MPEAPDAGRARGRTDADELADDAALDAALEALLLVVDAPTDDETLAAALDQPVARVRAALARLADSYAAAGRGIDLRHVGGGWRFYTRDAYAPYVERLLLDGQRARLTRAALETLAVVAYRQPVTRARVVGRARRELRRRAAHAAHPRPGAGGGRRPGHAGHPVPHHRAVPGAAGAVVARGAAAAGAAAARRRRDRRAVR